MTEPQNSTTDSDKWGDKEFEQKVRDTAYFLWEADGYPNGLEQEYWFRALAAHLRERDSAKMLQVGPAPAADTKPPE